MTSGKLTDKPDDLHRKTLLKRSRKAMIQAGEKIGRLDDKDKKTPSQKKSESMKARMVRRGKK